MFILNDSFFNQLSQNELSSSPIISSYSINEEFNNSSNIDVNQNDEIKESKKNNENLNNIFEDKENNTTGDLTKKKQKEKMKMKKKIKYLILKKKGGEKEKKVIIQYILIYIWIIL